MAVAVTVPRLGLDSPDALIAEWYQPDGASVQKGEPVYRLEVDFVAVEVEAEDDGVLRHQAQAGTALPAGEVVGYILATGERLPGEARAEKRPEEDTPDEADPATDEATEPTAEAEDAAPDDGEDVTEGRPAGAYPLADVLAAGAAHGSEGTSEPLPEGLPWDAFPGASTADEETDAFEAPQPVLLFPRIVDELKAEAQLAHEQEPEEEPAEPELEDESAPEQERRRIKVSAWDLVPGETDFNPDWIIERQLEGRVDAEGSTPGRDRFQASSIRKLALGRQDEPDEELDEDETPETEAEEPESGRDDDSPAADVQPEELGNVTQLVPESLPDVPSEHSDDESEDLPPGVVDPLARIASQEPGSGRRGEATPGRTLSMRVSVDMAEAMKMRDQLTREWWGSNVRPTDEDITLRAIGRALLESSGFRRSTDAVGMRFLTGPTRGVHLVPDAATRPFRDAVASLAALRETPGVEIPCACTLTPLGELNLDEAVPALPQGQPLAFAMGAIRDVARFRGEQPYRASEMLLTVAYDSDVVPDAVAARLLARVRELVEAPYALLAH